MQKSVQYNNEKAEKMMSAYSILSFSFIFLCFLSFYNLFIYYQEGTVGMAEKVPRDLEDLRDLKVYLLALVFLDVLCHKNWLIEYVNEAKMHCQ